MEIFPHSVVRVTSLRNAAVGRGLPEHGWTILTSILFSSSGWVNVLLWFITGRQFGFTAPSEIIASDDEGREGANPYPANPNGEPSSGVAFVQPNHWSEHQREQSTEMTFFRPQQQPPFPLSHTELPLNSDTSPMHAQIPNSSSGYPNAYHADVYHPGVYDVYRDDRR